MCSVDERKQLNTDRARGLKSVKGVGKRGCSVKCDAGDDGGVAQASLELDWEQYERVQ